MSWDDLAALGRPSDAASWEWPAELIGTVIGGLAELGWRVNGLEVRIDQGTQWVALRLADGDGLPAP